MAPPPWSERLTHLLSQPGADPGDADFMWALRDQLDAMEPPTRSEIELLLRLFEQHPDWDDDYELGSIAELVTIGEVADWLPLALASLERVPSAGVARLLEVVPFDRDDLPFSEIGRALYESFGRTSSRAAQKMIRSALANLATGGHAIPEIPELPPRAFPRDLDFTALLGPSKEDTLAALAAKFDEVGIGYGLSSVVYHGAGVSLRYANELQTVIEVVLDLSGQVREALPFGLRSGSREEAVALFGLPIRHEHPEIDGSVDVYRWKAYEVALEYDAETDQLARVWLRKASLVLLKDVPPISTRR